MINHRKNFTVLLDKIKAKKGVELGVAKGHYSKILNEAYKFEEFYCVDKWNSPLHGDKQRNITIEALKPYPWVKIIHSTFNDAIHQFPDEYFDFVYVDGSAHGGQENGETLRQWFPKVKKGGIFAGHDYCSRWKKTYDQVNLYIRDELGYEVYSTQEKIYPSWYIFK